MMDLMDGKRPILNPWTKKIIIMLVNITVTRVRVTTESLFGRND